MKCNLCKSPQELAYLGQQSTWKNRKSEQTWHLASSCSQWKELRRSYIHRDKSSFNDPFLKNIIKDDKKCIFYDNGQCKRHSWQGRISVCYPKGRTWWRKVYAADMVESQQYFSFCVFKPLSETQCRLILSTAVICAWKSSKNASHSTVEKMLYFPMIIQGYIKKE